MASLRWHWSVAAGSALVMFGAAIAFTGLAFFNGTVTEDLGFSVGAFTIYYLLYGVFTAIAMPFAGRLVDRLGARGLLGIGGAIATGGLLLFAASSTLPGFYAAGTLIGIGYGLSVQYVPVVLVNTWFVARRGLVMGLVLAGSGVGGALLSLGLPRIIDSAGWRTGILACAAVMGVATLVPALLLVRNKPADVGRVAYGELPDEALVGEAAPSGNNAPSGNHAPSGDDDGAAGNEERRRPNEPEFGGVNLADALRTPWLPILGASLVLLGLMSSMGQHIPNHLSGQGASSGDISVAMTVMTLSLVVLKPGLGHLVDFIGLRRAVVLTLGIFAATSAVSVLVTSMTLYFLVMVGFAAGFTNGTVTPPLVVVRAFGPRDFARTWGVLGMAYPLGMAVGTPTWGLVKDLMGEYTWAFLSVPVWVALILIGFALAVRGGRRMWVEQG